MRKLNLNCESGAEKIVLISVLCSDFQGKTLFGKTAVNNTGKEKAEMANNANFDALR